MAEAEINRKKRELAYSTERMNYHRWMMEEAPERRRYYEYYAHYFQTRRAEWQTRLWLETLRDIIKPEVRIGVPGLRAKEIRDELEDVETERVALVEHLEETRRLAVERRWRVAFPEYPTMYRWLSASYGRMAAIRFWSEEIDRELPPVEEFIGDELLTGLDIYYHLEDLVYNIRDPETKELVRTEKELVIEVTGSIRTRVGHDVPITLEITAITTVSEADGTEIIRITKRMGPLESGLIDYLKGTAWGELARRLDTMDHSFLGKSLEPRRSYPCEAPDYSSVAVWLERKSRYVKKRRYPETGCDYYEAE